MCTSSDEGESEATKIFASRSNRDFRNEFLGRRTTMKDIEFEKKIRELTLRLDESEIHKKEYEKLVKLAKSEATELRNNYTNILEKYKNAKHDIDNMKTEIYRLKEIENEYTSKKSSTEFLIQNYKTALTKYKIWYENSTKQLEVLKNILIELGKWTPENRYKIYFSYKMDTPNLVNDEDVNILAQGSIFEYKGIDDIENVNSIISSTKYFNNSTQTDSSSLNMSITEGSSSSCFSYSNSQINSNNNNEINIYKDCEINDLRERLMKIEQENLILKEKLFKNKENLSKNEQIEAEYERKIKESENKLLEEQKKNQELIKKLNEFEENLKSTNNNNNNGNDEDELTKTIADPSVVFYHLRDNPFSQAVKEYQERENKKMIIDPGLSNVYYEKYLQATEELEKLKNEIKKMAEQKERMSNFTAESARRYREIIRIITGYDIKMRNEEYIEMSSVYDPKNQFSFQKNGKEINVLASKYASSWENIMAQYLPGSLPCFTAKVTLELYNQHNSIVDQTL